LNLIKADASDAVSLKKMVSSTRAVLTTVGPYSEYGEPLVAACVAAGTDYLDITGEPDFVGNILKTYDDDARRKGVLIINCCGFDSIPADLGAYFTVQQLPADSQKTVKAYLTTKSKPSGGTWQSAVKAMSKGKETLAHSKAEGQKIGLTLTIFADNFNL
ncbi:MAG: saccharopine dehydrogenase NADP-binding domain-containing protein, partial [SAR324 cluster bacterium]|nr:saccharopine dehydrogenase NADP-binding domain-containing protein [SAR324 cluster bacterium]